MSDAYEAVARSSLKFKGGSSVGIKKKKKKSHKDKAKQATIIRDAIKEDKGAVTVIEQTEAQKKFEEIQKARQQQKILTAASRSHKDRVAEFNNKLESLSEHYDIPKVGPG